MHGKGSPPLSLASLSQTGAQLSPQPPLAPKPACASPLAGAAGAGGGADGVPAGKQIGPHSA